MTEIIVVQSVYSSVHGEFEVVTMSSTSAKRRIYLIGAAGLLVAAFVTVIALATGSPWGSMVGKDGRAEFESKWSLQIPNNAHLADKKVNYGALGDGAAVYSYEYQGGGGRGVSVMFPSGSGTGGSKSVPVGDPQAIVQRVQKEVGAGVDQNPSYLVNGDSCRVVKTKDDSSSLIACDRRDLEDGFVLFEWVQ